MSERNRARRRASIGGRAMSEARSGHNIFGIARYVILSIYTILILSKRGGGRAISEKGATGVPVYTWTDANYGIRII